ncbi:DUF572 domain-containing protein [Cephalotus follicularis]|uniref:DUF572 domain-containing protein n=1 Tax=Cephalotus follicularis TaxID=3775 RepID=A0A1Q3B7L9_CEPFO|nr:DUF572 domain-containing protein [Cephalotus follicularis]
MKSQEMLHMRMRCNTCGHCMGEGTKFKVCNCDLTSSCLHIIQIYVGIPIFRLYCNSKNCRAEFIIKTDPTGLEKEKKLEKEDEARVKSIKFKVHDDGDLYTTKERLFIQLLVNLLIL